MMWFPEPGKSLLPATCSLFTTFPLQVTSPHEISTGQCLISSLLPTFHASRPCKNSYFKIWDICSKGFKMQIPSESNIIHGHFNKLSFIRKYSKIRRKEMKVLLERMDVLSMISRLRTTRSPFISYSFITMKKISLLLKEGFYE